MQGRLTKIHDALSALFHTTAWARVPNSGAFIGSGDSTNFTQGFTRSPSVEATSGNADLRAYLNFSTGVDGEYENMAGSSVDGSEQLYGIIGAGDAAAVLDFQTSVGISIANSGDEVSGIVRTYTDVAAEVFRSITADVSLAGVAQTTVTIARNGSNSGISQMNGNVRFSYAEFDTGDSEIKAFVWRLSGMPSGNHVINFEFLTGLTPAASDVYALVCNYSAPFSSSDRKKSTTADRLNAIRDLPMVALMSDFIQIRNELAVNVREEHWLKSYHRHIFGFNANFVTSLPLTESQITSIKSRMLTPSSWESFVDLDGFIEKVYDDVGSLWALAQSTGSE
jgi:hypothetical protein